MRGGSGAAFPLKTLARGPSVALHSVTCSLGCFQRQAILRVLSRTPLGHLPRCFLSPEFSHWFPELFFPQFPSKEEIKIQRRQEPECGCRIECFYFLKLEKPKWGVQGGGRTRSSQGLEREGRSSWAVREPAPE